MEQPDCQAAKGCFQSETKAHRARVHNRSEFGEFDEECKAEKRYLARAILASNQSCWKMLCKAVNLGMGYKIITRRLGTLSLCASMDAGTVKNIWNTLFPTHPVKDTSGDPNHVKNFPAFREEELFKALSSLKNRTTPGPDGIPAKTLRVADSHPQLLVRMYNACLAEGVSWLIESLPDLF